MVKDAVIQSIVHKFKECNEDDMAQIFGEMWKPLSDDEIRALCKIKI